jgi:SAM-dependent methyltransferase
MSKVDLEWNDENVLPPVLSPDTDFVFRRMTEETLKAVDSGNGKRILDVGCGRGIDASAMARQGGNLFGCEPSRVMIRKAKTGFLGTGDKVTLVSSVAETLPFNGGAFTRVVCKGAIDHFENPDHAVAEMSRVAAPGGRVVISVANFESLSCSLGRKLNAFYRRIFRKPIPGPHIWVIPSDHTFKFDYPSGLRLAEKYLAVERVKGVSLLWGFPGWPKFLKGLPKGWALIILKLLDRIATWNPRWSDVLIIAGRPLKRG